MKLLILMIALFVCLCACTPTVTPETTTVPQPSQTEAPATTTNNIIIEETGEPGLLKPEYEDIDPLLPFTFPPEYGEFEFPEIELEEGDYVTVTYPPVPVTTESTTGNEETLPPTTEKAVDVWGDEPGVVLPEDILDD